MKASDRERLKRIRTAWEADAPSPFELTTARQRYLERRGAVRGRPMLYEFGWGLGLAAAVLVGFRLVSLIADADPHGMESELAQAASAPVPSSTPVMAEQSDGVEPRATGAPAGEKRPEVLAAYRATLERAGESFDVAPGTPYTVPVGETVVVRLGSETQTVTGPSVLEFQLDPARASGWRMVTRGEEALSEPPRRSPREGIGDDRTPVDSTDSVKRRGAEDATKPPRGLTTTAPTAGFDAPRAKRTSAPPGGTWSEVAEAMRASNHARAEAALQRLLRSSDPATRDSAQLTLAQIWLSQGRRQDGRSMLRTLADTGATAFIRRRAAELLGE